MLVISDLNRISPTQPVLGTRSGNYGGTTSSARHHDRGYRHSQLGRDPAPGHSFAPHAHGLAPPEHAPLPPPASSRSPRGAVTPATTRSRMISRSANAACSRNHATGVRVVGVDVLRDFDEPDARSSLIRFDHDFDINRGTWVCIGTVAAVSSKISKLSLIGNTAMRDEPILAGSA